MMVAFLPHVVERLFQSLITPWENEFLLVKRNACFLKILKLWPLVLELSVIVNKQFVSIRTDWFSTLYTYTPCHCAFAYILTKVVLTVVVFLREGSVLKYLLSLLLFSGKTPPVLYHFDSVVPISHYHILRSDKCSLQG